MMRICGTSILFFIYFFCVAQTNDAYIVKSRLSNVLTLGPGNRYAEGFDNRNSEVVGSEYLFESWQRGSVIFNDNTKVDSLLLKYDILNQQVEIRLGKEVKVGNENQIKEFYLLNENQNGYDKYLSLLKYKDVFEGEFIGYVEVLYEGNVLLLKKTYLLVQKPNYKEGIDVGNKDVKLLKRKKIFLVEDGSVVEMKNKKSFQNHKKAVSSYIKINKLDLNNERHLFLLVEYYDSL